VSHRRNALCAHGESPGRYTNEIMFPAKEALNMTINALNLIHVADFISMTFKLIAETSKSSV